MSMSSSEHDDEDEESDRKGVGGVEAVVRSDRLSADSLNVSGATLSSLSLFRRFLYALGRTFNAVLRVTRRFLGSSAEQLFLKITLEKRQRDSSWIPTQPLPCGAELSP